MAVGHETVRQWGPKFGQDFTDRTRRRLPRAGDEWHLVEIAVEVAGEQHWLWRTVDQGGTVLDILVQSRRDKAAAERLPRKLLEERCRAPRVTITDKLADRGATEREVMLEVEHLQHKASNNRAENSHQPTRRRERRMECYESPGYAQRLLSAHDRIDDPFHPP